MYYIGIDLGTSAVKLLLVDDNGTILNEVSREYPMSFPHPGWSEQRPEDWWNAVELELLHLLQGFDHETYQSIHSLVSSWDGF